MCRQLMKAAIFVVLLSACCFANSAFPEDGVTKRPSVEKLIRDQLNAWSQEDEALFLSTVHPDIVFAYPGARLDKKGTLELFRYWADNYSDTRIYFHNIIIEGNDKIKTSDIKDQMYSLERNLLRRKLHGEGKARRKSALLAVGLGKQLVDRQASERHVFPLQTKGSYHQDTKVAKKGESH